MKIPNLRGLFRSILQLGNVRLVHAHTLHQLRTLEESLVKLKEFHVDMDQGGSKIHAVFEDDPAASLYVAAAFSHMIFACDNYREIAFTPNRAAQAKLGCKFITVLVQKQEGKTPHQMRQDAEMKLARLQLAMLQAAKPFKGPIEWLGPENKENGVDDGTVVLTGSSGRITLGDLRRVAELFKHPDFADVTVLDKNGENLVIDAAQKAIKTLHQIGKEVKKSPHKKNGRLLDNVNLTGALLNSILRRVVGEEKAPVYERDKEGM